MRKRCGFSTTDLSQVVKLALGFAAIALCISAAPARALSEEERVAVITQMEKFYFDRDTRNANRLIASFAENAEFTVFGNITVVGRDAIRLLMQPIFADTLALDHIPISQFLIDDARHTTLFIESVYYGRKEVNKSTRCFGVSHVYSIEEFEFNDEGLISKYTTTPSRDWPYIKSEMECTGFPAPSRRKLQYYEVADVGIQFQDSLSTDNLKKAISLFPSSNTAEIYFEFGGEVARNRKELYRLLSSWLGDMRHFSFFSSHGPFAPDYPQYSGGVYRTIAMLNKRGCRVLIKAMDRYQLDEDGKIVFYKSKWSRPAAEVRLELQRCLYAFRDEL